MLRKDTNYQCDTLLCWAVLKVQKSFITYFPRLLVLIHFEDLRLSFLVNSVIHLRKRLLHFIQYLGCFNVESLSKFLTHQITRTGKQDGFL